jgi:hypothetical protein
MTIWNIFRIVLCDIFACFIYSFQVACYVGKSNWVTYYKLLLVRVRPITCNWQSKSHSANDQWNGDHKWVIKNTSDHGVLVLQPVKLM